MTDGAPRQPRFSKRLLRAWAWIAGGVAFLSPWAILGLSPKPPVSAASAQLPRQVIIVRKITRRVVIQDAPKAAPVRYVYVNGGSSSSGGSTVSAPATTSTGGSAPA